MSTIHYAVEITTDTTGTDVTYGLVSGVFRELLKVSFVGVTGIKSLGLNLYYSKV